MRAPNSKAEFRQRYAAGEFGNRPRTWFSQRELHESGYSGTVTCRALIPGALCDYRVHSWHATCDPKYKDYAFNESMPDELLTIQGEVMRDTSGLYLAYSTEPNLVMRVAMQTQKAAYRSAAEAILRHYLTPTSYADIQELLDAYDGVVEFSTYGQAVGNLPFRNTVIWEVRNY